MWAVKGVKPIKLVKGVSCIVSSKSLKRLGRYMERSSCRFLSKVTYKMN